MYKINKLQKSKPRALGKKVKRTFKAVPEVELTTHKSDNHHCASIFHCETVIDVYGAYLLKSLLCDLQT
jgi:hypothetical protein